MKSRWNFCAVALSACLLLGGCASNTTTDTTTGSGAAESGSAQSNMKKGDISQVERIFETDSPDYTEKEINAAMDAVIAYFGENLQGCTLKQLKYNKDRQNEDWSQYGAKNGIVLSSVFDVDENGGDGTLNPNETVGDNWTWILVQDEDGAWVLKNYGY